VTAPLSGGLHTTGGVAAKKRRHLQGAIALLRRAWDYEDRQRGRGKCAPSRPYVVHHRIRLYPARRRRKAVRRKPARHCPRCAWQARQLAESVASVALVAAVLVAYAVLDSGVMQ